MPRDPADKDDDRETPTAPRSPSAILRAAEFQAELERMRREHEAKLEALAPTDEWKSLAAALLSLVKPRCGLCANPATKRDDIAYRCDGCAQTTMKGAIDLPHAETIRRALAKLSDDAGRW